MSKYLVLFSCCLALFVLNCVADSPPEILLPHPETIGDFHEGDIVLRENDPEIEFNGIVDSSYKWPKDKITPFVLVPFTISSDFSKLRIILCIM